MSLEVRGSHALNMQSGTALLRTPHKMESSSFPPAASTPAAVHTTLPGLQQDLSTNLGTPLSLCTPLCTHMDTHMLTTHNSLQVHDCHTHGQNAHPWASNFSRLCTVDLHLITPKPSPGSSSHCPGSIPTRAGYRHSEEPRHTCALLSAADLALLNMKTCTVIWNTISPVFFRGERGTGC